MINKENIDLLVFTDRYLPNAVGGAELSLNGVLREVPRNKTILVISLFSKGNKLEKYNFDGVDIIAFPEPLSYPFECFNPQIMGKLLKISFLRKFLKTLLIKHRKHKLIDGNIETEFSNIYYLKKLKKILKNYEFNTLHADNYRSIIIAKLIKKYIKSQKFVAVIRDNRFHTKSDLKCLDSMNHEKKYYHNTLKSFDNVIVTSNYLKRSISSLYKNLNLCVIGNPVDDLASIEGECEGVGELPDFNILIIGMITENKGQIQFIKNLHREIKRCEGIKIHFVGRGKRIEERIKYFSHKYEIDNKVLLHGYLSRMETYKMIKKCQLLVLPTLWDEPFGRVPLEAAIMKKPVIAFNSGGLSESIIDQKTGIIVEKDDFKMIFKRILELKNDSVERSRLGLSAKEKIIEKFSAEKIFKDYSKVWSM
jgi:glycosyltransferase involved in cell wall biosynthesis